MRAWLRRQVWFRRLSGQLVLSHVFVAVVVLAFALGVSQVTFRQYLVKSQLSRLSTQGQTIARVMHGYFTGTLYAGTGAYLIRVLQGTLNDRVYVVNDTGQVLLETGNSQLPGLAVPNGILVRVLEHGRPYRGIVAHDLALIGVPVSVGNQVAGGVFLESPLSLSNKTANSLTRLLLFGELAAVVLVGALAYAISWRLSKPLENLRKAVSEMGHSGSETRVRALEEGPQEVQALAREFNRLEDRIDVQVEQLTREAEARDALMAHVAHDLRTPLTSIRGFLEAMRDGIATGDVYDRAVQVAWEETLRLQRLVDRLLRATRIRSEGGPMAPLPVSEWIIKTLERVQPVSEKKGIHLLWDHREEATLLGNEDFLMEALMNVLDNAIKWSPQDGIIRVNSAIDGNMMVVSVLDEGPGIPEELLPRVFERFVTGDASRQQSSGLGLSIVDEVMRQHQGEVRIHAGPTGGTVVELRLPVQPASVG